MKNSTARPFRANAVVTFRPGLRPVASTLPASFVVFMSDRRATVVLIDGRPVTLATVALTTV